MSNPSRPDGLVHFGRITGLFGIQGWVKVFSHARPREAIVEFSPWLVETGGDWREFEVEERFRCPTCGGGINIVSGDRVVLVAVTLVEPSDSKPLQPAEELD